jgi:hypothetical protein
MEGHHAFFCILAFFVFVFVSVGFVLVLPESTSLTLELPLLRAPTTHWGQQLPVQVDGVSSLDRGRW